MGRGEPLGICPDQLGEIILVIRRVLAKIGVEGDLPRGDGGKEVVVLILIEPYGGITLAGLAYFGGFGSLAIDRVEEGGVEFEDADRVHILIIVKLIMDAKWFPKNSQENSIWAYALHELVKAQHPRTLHPRPRLRSHAACPLLP